MEVNVGDWIRFKSGYGSTKLGEVTRVTLQGYCVVDFLDWVVDLTQIIEVRRAPASKPLDTDFVFNEDQGKVA
jgi:hypothetical protein